MLPTGEQAVSLLSIIGCTNPLGDASAASVQARDSSHKADCDSGDGPMARCLHPENGEGPPPAPALSMEEGQEGFRA